MNGFANAVLSLLLSWIRVIISQFWKLISGDTGEKLFSFFSKNWLVLVIILCVAGIAADLLVYFLRWRPDKVWRSRRLKKEEEWAEEEQLEASAQAPVSQGFQWEDDSGFYPDDGAVQRGSYSAGYATAGFQPVRGQRALDVMERQVAPYVQPAPRPEAEAETPPTAVYSPVSQQTPPTTVYTPIVPVQSPSAQTPADFEPVFDDASLDWAQGDDLLSNPPARYNEAMGAGFTTPMSRPDSYFRDMQAGYAPQLTPQQMYAPNVPGPESAPSGSVHPGLDADSLRRNIGLSPAGSLADRQEEVYKINTNPMNGAAAPTRSKNLLTTLARKARDFMGADDTAERTIYDLQPTVDMNNAFHEPVYPQPRLSGKDDQTSNF